MSASVVIAGGGLVGLSLSLMLAKAGIASRLIEARPFRSDNKRGDYLGLDSRNTALSRRSVQIYTDLGLWDELKSHAQPINEVQISEIGGFGKARLRADQEQVESFGQVIENRWLGRQLLTMARSQPLITLTGGAQIESLELFDDQVKLSLSGQSEPVSTQLLIAADGQNSFCRQALNIKTRKRNYQQLAVVGVVETDQAHEQVAFERFGPKGPLALLPLAGENQNRRSVVWIAPEGSEDELMGSHNDAQFLALLQRAFGYRAGAFVRAGPRGAYPLVQVIAERQFKGRAVLMGNAAHTLHPVAGQGFNLCLRDAAVFTEHLKDFSVNHQLTQTQPLQEMLKAYARAREKDQQRVSLFCDTLVRGFTHPSPLVKAARNLGLIAFDSIPGFKPLVARFAMGLKV